MGSQIFPPKRNLWSILTLVFTSLLPGGCRDDGAVGNDSGEIAPLKDIASPATGLPANERVQFVDAAVDLGVVLKNVSGDSEQSYVIDTMMGGSAFIDYDNEG